MVGYGYDLPCVSTLGGTPKKLSYIFSSMILIDIRRNVVIWILQTMIPIMHGALQKGVTMTNPYVSDGNV